MIVFLSYKNEKKTLALQAADAINTILNDGDLSKKVSKLLNNVMEKLVKLIEITEVPQFWDSWMEILRTHSTQIKSNCPKGHAWLLEIINSCSKRISSEIHNLKSSNTGKKNNIFISRCWNTIRVCTDSSNYVPE